MSLTRIKLISDAEDGLKWEGTFTDLPCDSRQLNVRN